MSENKKCCESGSACKAEDCQELSLKPGTYWMCACGKSDSLPFCNGAHKQEGKYRPLKVEVAEEQNIKWCK